MKISEALKTGVLVFDGPMGTELYRHHIFTNRCFEELNLSEAPLIRRIHSDYTSAGAECLTTNTFAANRASLEKYGLAEKLADICRSGARIAREVADEAGRTVYVAGSVGPFPPNSPRTEERILEIVDPLIEGGADFILFETISSRAWLELCARTMKLRPEVPFMLSIAVTQGTETITGESLAYLFTPLPSDCGEPFAWGLNCGNGPDGLLESVEKAVHLTTLPLIVQPNAGLPKEFEGRHLYYCSPEYVATYAQRFVNLGVAGVGGCCGMTPEHIEEIVKAVKPLAKTRTSKAVLQNIQPEVQEKPEKPFEERSRLAWKLANRKWIQTVELVPPRGYDLSSTIEKSRKLHRHGIDAINIPDGPRASSRISPLIVALRIQQEANIEALLHFCCRDRNLIGMQADLLACAASEVHNILFITGDPPKLGLYPDATGVFDTDSIGMCAVQRRLNRGVDIGGQEIVPPTEAVMGVGLDPNALDQDRELDRFRQKVEAGAHFAITQPVFDRDALLTFLDRIEKEHGNIPIPVIIGIWPFASYRNAQFMKNEVPGVVVPDAIMDRMEQASRNSKDDQMKVGIDIARELLHQVHDIAAGVQISAPFGRIEIALAVME